jgi:hypothetical protein
VHQHDRLALALVEKYDLDRAVIENCHAEVLAAPDHRRKASLLGL